MRGGLTYAELLAHDARARLEKDHEHHNVVKLPCCGSSVEVTDTTRDTFVVCPNEKCMKRHVIVGNRNNVQIKSEVSPDESNRNLIW